MTAQQNTAPPSCRACGHVALVSITQGQRVERYDRCEHPSGPRPMHVTMQQAAAWHLFQKAMGGDGYWVEYASVGEIADAVVELIVKEAGK